jgi:uncharacterized protein with HEPN domain
MPLDVFETDWQRQWLVERGVEIISEASRHLTEDPKARHPEIPWQKVAGIGNVLRHNYESIAAPIIWKLTQANLACAAFRIKDHFWPGSRKRCKFMLGVDAEFQSTSGRSFHGRSGSTAASSPETYKRPRQSALLWTFPAST